MIERPVTGSNVVHEAAHGGPASIQAMVDDSKSLLSSPVSPDLSWSQFGLVQQLYEVRFATRLHYPRPVREAVSNTAAFAACTS